MFGQIQDTEADDLDDVEPVSALTVEKGYALCSEALLDSGGVLLNADAATIGWLCSRRIVDVYEAGVVCLARDVIQHGLKAVRPVLERTCRSEGTTLELLVDMLADNWRFVEDFRNASIEDKKAVLGNPTTYYTLLKHFTENVLMYEASGAFHHKQQERYYAAIETAIIHHTDTIVDVPPYKKAGYYTDLKEYLAGDSEFDPATAEDQPRRNTDLLKGHLVLLNIYIYVYLCLQFHVHCVSVASPGGSIAVVAKWKERFDKSVVVTMRYFTSDRHRVKRQLRSQ